MTSIEQKCMGVGVGKSLEIDQVALRRTVAVAVEFDPLGDLLPDALRGHAIKYVGVLVALRRDVGNLRPRLRPRFSRSASMDQVSQQPLFAASL